MHYRFLRILDFANCTSKLSLTRSYVLSVSSKSVVRSKGLISFRLTFFLWLRWVFVVACKLSLVVVSGSYSSCGAFSSRSSGFSCGAQALGWVGFSSCRARASLLHGMWDPLRPSVNQTHVPGIGRWVRNH